MEFLVALWLPILVAAVLVFIVSSVIHMAVPIHKNDYKKLADEDGVLEAMREKGVQPGEYMFPNAGSMKECGSPEMIAKFEQGPVGFMTVLTPGPMNMGKFLSQWFVFTIVMSVFVAYTASFSLPDGAAYMDVFRLTGTVAFLGYAGCVATNSIWKGVSWMVTAKFLFDGLLYALATAGAFAWLWPEA